MKPIPLTEETAAVARRIIWFEPPELALADPVRFLAYAMERATAADLRVLHPHVSAADWRAALAAAPPGIIGPRSWAYWHAMFGTSPPPPPPNRNLSRA